MRTDVSEKHNALEGKGSLCVLQCVACGGVAQRLRIGSLMADVESFAGKIEDLLILASDEVARY